MRFQDVAHTESLSPHLLDLGSDHPVSSRAAVPALKLLSGEDFDGQTTELDRPSREANLNLEISNLPDDEAVGSPSKPQMFDDDHVGAWLHAVEMKPPSASVNPR